MSPAPCRRVAAAAATATPSASPLPPLPPPPIPPPAAASVFLYASGGRAAAAAAAAAALGFRVDCVSLCGAQCTRRGRRSRMKACAGEHWQARDPYWGGRPARRSKYCADGFVRSEEAAAAAASAAAPAQARRAQPEGPLGPEPEPEPQKLSRWRFARSCCGVGGALGQYVRTEHDGREVPTKVLSRHTNWGFVSESMAASSARPPAAPRAAFVPG